MENARDKAPPSWRRGKIFGLVSFSPGGWWRRGVERSSDDAQYSRRRRFFFFSGLSIIPPPPSPAQDAQISPTHTHTTKMASSPPLCNFFLYFILFFQGFLSFSENGSDPSTLFRPPLETFDNWEALIFSTIPFTHPPVVSGLCLVYSFTHTKIAADKSPPGSALVSLLMQRAAKSSTVIDDFKKSRFFLCFLFYLFVCFSLLLRIFFLFRPDVYPLSDI